jgi:hypothetical protein
MVAETVVVVVLEDAVEDAVEDEARIVLARPMHKIEVLSPILSPKCLTTVCSRPNVHFMGKACAVCWHQLWARH